MTGGPSVSRVFGDDVQGRDCGAEAADWLSRFLGGRRAYRLVHFETQMKPRRSAGQEELFPRGEVRRAPPRCMLGRSTR